MGVHRAPRGGSATGLITCPWRGSGLLQRSCRPRCQSVLVQLQEEIERSQEPHLLPSLQLNWKALPTHAASSRLEPGESLPPGPDSHTTPCAPHTGHLLQNTLGRSGSEVGLRAGAPAGGRRCCMARPELALPPPRPLAQDGTSGQASTHHQLGWQGQVPRGGLCAGRIPFRGLQGKVSVSRVHRGPGRG